MWPTAWAIGVAVSLQTAPPAKPAVDPWPDSRPITHLVQNLAKDVRDVPSQTTARVLVAAAMGGAIAGSLDERAADWASRAGPAQYTKFGDVLGSAAVQGGGALATYAVGRLTHRPAVTHVGGDLIRAQVLAGIVTQGLKFTIDRTRPDGGRHSMPSGHTSATFASATVLGEHFGWKVAVPAYAVASYVAWSRVRDQRHYPSDDVLGAAIGLIAGTTVTRGHREWTVVPVKTAGGFAVYFMR
jgi:membrane-associated phospholipid phosphatase